jgi:hypothetical protein
MDDQRSRVASRRALAWSIALLVVLVGSWLWSLDWSTPATLPDEVVPQGGSKPDEIQVSATADDQRATRRTVAETTTVPPRNSSVRLEGVVRWENGVVGGGLQVEVFGVGTTTDAAGAWSVEVPRPATGTSIDLAVRAPFWREPRLFAVPVSEGEAGEVVRVDLVTIPRVFDATLVVATWLRLVSVLGDGATLRVDVRQSVPGPLPIGKQVASGPVTAARTELTAVPLDVDLTFALIADFVDDGTRIGALTVRVTDEAEAVPTVEVVPELDRVFRGQVVDQDGRPLGCARLTCRFQDENGVDLKTRGEADASGAFLLVASGPANIEIRYGDAKAVVDGVRGGPDLRLTLDLSGRRRMQVVHAGVPVERAVALEFRRFFAVEKPYSIPIAPGGFVWLPFDDLGDRTVLYWEFGGRTHEVPLTEAMLTGDVFDVAGFESTELCTLDLELPDDPRVTLKMTRRAPPGTGRDNDKYFVPAAEARSVRFHGLPLGRYTFELRRARTMPGTPPLRTFDYELQGSARIRLADYLGG